MTAYSVDPEQTETQTYIEPTKLQSFSRAGAGAGAYLLWGDSVNTALHHRAAPNYNRSEQNPPKTRM